MTDQQPSAPARAKSGRFTRGVEHVNEPHTDNFVVVGNHLVQHPELSLTAIGLAVHIQSLPSGTPVGIKVLAAKFPEGEIRIAAALRELEEHGYLARPKERLQSGQYVTRTLSYNKPRPAVLQAAAEPEPQPAKSPQSPAAANLLAELRTYDSRLLLTERDVQRLTPAVETWLERGVPATAVLRTLASGLPTAQIKHPAAFLAHRLKELLPPALPTPEPVPAPAGRLDPWQDCDGDCGRVFRAPEPGRCRDCRTATVAA
ncbi:helix-turn-helix domain-containing protein [Streptomyces sp. NBC_00028]|uniref:helix-turn-helix domain-containing protein n=1 Tax=Streptomyces sp. NBC_00028 TaxID=2975624 RepID=UPI003252C8A4